jgi:hypothetical protein
MASKISFDIIKREITITVAPVLEDGDFVIDLDIQKELYSQGKNDWVASNNLRRLRFPISAVGGNDLPGSKVLGDTYFIRPDWKINPYEADHRFRVNGNFYSTDGKTPFNRTVGNFNIFLEQTVSSLVDSTVQQLSEIEFATFNGGVTIDEINGTLDLLTGLPGSPSNPVRLLEDAHAIQVARKLPKKVFVKGNLTITNSVSWEGYEFEGESAIKSLITVNDAANVLNCEFYDCTLTGILDGSSQIEKSVIINLDFVDGFIFRCSIGPGTMKLGTSTVANIYECYSGVPGATTPIYDLNATGIINMKGYDGGAWLKNYSGNASHTIDLRAGQVILDPTIVSGTFVVRGVGKLVDINGKQIQSTNTYDDDGNILNTTLWNGGVTIVNELNSSYKQDRIFDLLNADEVKDKLNSKYYKLRQGTTDVLLEKNYTNDSNEEKLTKP